MTIDVDLKKRNHHEAPAHVTTPTSTIPAPSPIIESS